TYEAQLNAQRLAAMGHESVVKQKRKTWMKSSASEQAAAVASELPSEVKSAIKKLHSLAAAGNEDAVFAAAEMELYGKYGTAVSVDAAYAHYAQLAELTGNATAHYMLGFLHGTGLGNVTVDNGRSLLHTTLAAVQGHAAAKATLGFRASAGIGTSGACSDALEHYGSVARDAVRFYHEGPPLGRHLPGYRARLSDDRGGVFGVRTGALALHRATTRAAFGELLEAHQHSAAQGSLRAHVTLADLFYHGHRFAPRDFGAARSHVTAVIARLFTRAGGELKAASKAESDAAAQAAGFLGVMCLRGEGADADLGAALRWLTIGARLGHATAMNALGSMYRDGTGVAADPARAAALFKQAAEKRHAGGQVNYALHVMRAQPDEALGLLRLAAESGHVLAHYHLAAVYAAQPGESACRMAVASFRFVAEHADWLHSPLAAAEAAAARGSVETATVLYMQAAEMGYSVGQLNAALLLEHPSNALSSAGHSSLAHVYWTRAANQNVADARTKQGDAYYYGRGGVAQSYERAAAAYKLAARSEANGLAMWSLGWMYENGLGVPKDFHLAKRWYDQSLEANPEGRLAVHASLARLCLRYFWAWAKGEDVGEAPLFFAPRVEKERKEEEEEKQSDHDDDDDGAQPTGVPAGSLGESVFFIVFLLAAAWMFLPFR
ncbi:ERAD-associated protein, partial [Coemansia aciculifera]